MKTYIRTIVVLLISITTAFSQTKIDTERMDRDLEIAENALATIIKQQYEKRNMWIEVKSGYTPGFGVTMRLPNDNANWIYEYGFNVKPGVRAVIAPSPGRGGFSWSGDSAPVVVYSGDEDEGDKARNKAKEKMKEDRRDDKDKPKESSTKTESRDSARFAYYAAMIKASKDFLADYGDLISQLGPNEKILITNRGEGGRHYYDWGNRSQKRQLVTIEATKADISAFRQGKINRDQMMAKISVVNTETTNDIETDLELYSSIMSRLYRSDLSKTFYTEENIYYERLKNFGVIYYMNAYSSNEQSRAYSSGNNNNEKNEGKIWAMPTQRLEGLTQEQRDKKVIELYPVFEKDIKDNMVEYAKTIKSLKDEEMIVFNIQITKCVGCGIPSNLELTLKNSFVRQFAAGTLTKEDAIKAINVKKGVAQ